MLRCKTWITAALTLCLLAQTPVVALDETEWGRLEEQGWCLDGGMLVQYAGEETDVVIPDGVTVIGEGAFYGRPELTSVSIPDSVTEIHTLAFYGCSGLIGVVIPDSVTELGEDAFADCGNLAAVTMPEGFLGSCQDYFSGTPWLEAYQSETGIEAGEDFLVEGYQLVKYQGAGGDVVIPDGVTVIGENAFRSCEGLTSVVIPDTVTTIEAGAFNDCLRLTQVTIPDSVTEIQWNAFYYCVSLARVDLGENVATIGTSAFEGCRTLTEITIPSGRIGKTAFRDCENLSSVTLGDGVTEIGELAFRGCGSLTQVTFGSGLERIDDEAFSQSPLTTVVLPDGLTSIGKLAFSASLRDIAIPASVSQIASEALDSCGGATLHVVAGSKAESYAMRQNKPYESDYEEFVNASLSAEEELPLDSGGPSAEQQPAQTQESGQAVQNGGKGGSGAVAIVIVAVLAAAAAGGYVVLKKRA